VSINQQILFQICIESFLSGLCRTQSQAKQKSTAVSRACGKMLEKSAAQAGLQNIFLGCCFATACKALHFLGAESCTHFSDRGPYILCVFFLNQL